MVTANIIQVRKGTPASSKYMDLIIKPRKIAHKLVPVNKRTIGKRKRPYHIQKKHLQIITCKLLFLSFS